jgi:hypothetical protein
MITPTITFFHQYVFPLFYSSIFLLVFTFPFTWYPFCKAVYGTDGNRFQCFPYSFLPFLLSSFFFFRFAFLSFCFARERLWRNNKKIQANVPFSGFYLNGNKYKREGRSFGNQNSRANAKRNGICVFVKQLSSQRQERTTLCPRDGRRDQLTGVWLGVPILYFYSHAQASRLSTLLSLCFVY